MTYNKFTCSCITVFIFTFKATFFKGIYYTKISSWRVTAAAETFENTALNLLETTIFYIKKKLPVHLNV